MQLKKPSPIISTFWDFKIILIFHRSTKNNKKQKKLFFFRTRLSFVLNVIALEPELRFLSNKKVFESWKSPVRKYL